MTREEHLKFCQLCKNRKLDFEQGLLCKLTNEKADFEKYCPSFEPEEKHNLATPDYSQTSSANTEDSGISWKTIGSGIIIVLIIIRFIMRMSR